MSWLLNFFLGSLLVICAVAAIQIKDNLSAVVILCGYSFLMCVLFAMMNAVDVALTKAAVGSGITTILFITAIFRSTRKTKD